MTNLNSAIELDFKKFFHWWEREISSLIPENIKDLIFDRHGTLIVRPEGGQFIVSFWQNAQEEDLGTFSRDELGMAALRKLVDEDTRLQKADVVIRLSKKYALQKELVLPAAARENLHQVVSYELSRYSPFKAEQAYFAVKTLDIPNEPGLIKVMLIITARHVLDRFYNDLTAFDLVPVVADYENLQNDLDNHSERYNLLPPLLQPQADRTARIVHYSLGGLVSILFIAALALPVWFESKSVAELEEKAKIIEKEAKSTKALQAKLDAAISETQRLIDRKTEKPMIVEALDTLTRLIKDDTWLAYAQYANGQLQIQGESPEASTLISVLEESEFFGNAKFVSPVTRDNITKLERFQITADITKAGATKSESGKN
jgi:general secretion pathway protein L